MTADEILLKIGIDNTRLAAGLTIAKDKVKAAFGNSKDWKEAGEKAGESFAHAFGGRMLLRMGAFFAVLKLAEKTGEVFGVGDKLKNMTLPGGGTWNSDKDEGRAAEKGEEVDKKMEEFAAKKARYNKDLVESEREIAKLKSKEMTEAEDLNALEQIARDSQGEFESAERDRSLNKLQRYELEKKMLQDQNAAVEKRKSIEKENAEALKKYHEEKKKAAKEEADSKIEVAKIDEEIGRVSRRYQRAQDEAYDNYKPSLQELAGANFRPTQFNLGNGPGAREAQRIMYEQNLGKYQFSQGNIVGGKATINDANKRYDYLADKGMLPQRQDKVNEKMISMADRMDDLVSQKKTILVKAKMG